ncbi:GAF domain-containing protein [Pseudomonadales bacterium]|nr:GAF domain-containing protein [Pseudomonadales bacterium]
MSETTSDTTTKRLSLDPVEQLRRAEFLLDVSRKVSGLTSLDDILAELVEISTREIGAERGTLFLNDPQTGELYSRIAQGIFKREIRVLNDRGIAGHVFTQNKSEIVADAYADSRFNRDVDEKTDFVTKSILCVPLLTVRGEVIGVTQVLNKINGAFNEDDLALLESIIFIM